MPYRRTRRYRRRRRLYRPMGLRRYRRRRPALRSVAVRRPVVPLGSLAPATAVVKMKTSILKHFNTANLQSMTMNMNCANLPFDGSGNQGRGYDQWCTLYQRVIVTSFKLIVRATCLRNTAGGTAEQPDAIVGLLVAGALPSDTEWGRISEFPNSTSRLLPARTQEVVRFSLSGSTKGIYGVSVLDVGDFSTEAQASGTQLPTKIVQGAVYCDIMSTAGTCDTRAHVQIIQVCKFFDPRSPVAS